MHMEIGKNEKNPAAINELPLGFSMALAMNERAMERYAGMTAEEKAQVVARCRAVESKAEMQGIVEELGSKNSP